MMTPCKSMAGLLKKSICSPAISSPAISFLEISGPADEGGFTSSFTFGIPGLAVPDTSRGAVSSPGLFNPVLFNPGLSNHGLSSPGLFIGPLLVGTSTFFDGGGASNPFPGKTSLGEASAPTAPSP